LDAKKVEVIETGPTARVRSIEALRPRSALRGTGTASRASPAASVSSLSGVGAKNPWPADTRLVHPSQRNSADMRGLRNVPNRL
jgi:hypothetical protein